MEDPMNTPTFYRYWYGGRIIAAVLQTDTGYSVGIASLNPQDKHDMEFGQTVAMRKMNSRAKFSFLKESAKAVGGIFAALCASLRKERDALQQAHTTGKIPYAGIVSILSKSHDLPSWLVYEMLRHEGPYTKSHSTFEREFHKLVQRAGGWVAPVGSTVTVQMPAAEWNTLMKLYRREKNEARAEHKAVEAVQRLIARLPDQA